LNYKEGGGLILGQLVVNKRGFAGGSLRGVWVDGTYFKWEWSQ